MTTSSQASGLPLEGIRVVDLADEKGELCGRILADLGADVVRVEGPEGARSRRLAPHAEGHSLYFAYRNANKRGIVLDLDEAPGRERLDDLLARVDVAVTSFAPARLDALGLSPAALVEHFPHLVAVSITDFGLVGPYRDHVATDATMEAIAGTVWKAGTPDGAPLLPPSAVAYDVAGVIGAFASLAALLQRERSGHGQAIDLSVLEAMAQATDWSFSNASYALARGQEPPEMRVGSGPMYRIYACKGGYVRLVILSPRQWHAMREWLGDPDFLQDPKYDSFLGRMEIADALAVMIGDLFATMSHQEVAFEAQKRGIVCTPVLTPDEILANEHYASRGTFVPLEYAPGVSAATASGFFEIDGERMGPRTRAPEPDEHGAEVAAGIWSDERRVPPGGPPAASRPFEGLRVLDFGIGGVGVEAGRLFADYGAEVVKIESRSYPDFMRVIMSTEMSASFASSSRSKKGFGVNLKHERGLEVVHELVRRADVVIENNRTGAMDAMGVGFEKIRELNPRCVMASSQLLGSRGVWSDWVGYGPSTQPIGGFVYLWSYAGREEPAGSTSIFPDHLAGRLTAIGALAALLRRERTTGRGGHVEVAQAETVVNMLGDRLLEAALRPGTVVPRGNASDDGAPWGLYPCRGEEQWVAISVRDDADWGRLRMALGDPEWSAAPALARAEGRLAARAALDEGLAAWTRERSREEVTSTLQMFGVPAAPMFTGSDQLHDPHFQARGYLQWIDQQDLGWICLEGPAFRATGMLDVDTRQAPRLGEHTRAICHEVLGLDPDEIEALVEAGTLEVPPTDPGSGS